ncbi:unnamed protein product [Anisakis simplex]|uniref:Valine--tRNA ligase n=1 Tax=Anisakis simplex TaxID=6269 RepID=A0A0M3J529_ANISI|nr:unnamed protein product [Anisakis simplex]
MFYVFEDVCVLWSDGKNGMTSDFAGLSPYRQDKFDLPAELNVSSYLAESDIALDFPMELVDFWDWCSYNSIQGAFIQR